MTERPLERRNPPGGAGSEGAFAEGGMQANHTPPTDARNVVSQAAVVAATPIEKRLARCDELVPGWSMSALSRLWLFARTQSTPWTCETYRAWAHDAGLEVHPEQRAFGAIIRTGLREGWFTRVGFAPAISSHRAPKPLYLGGNREGA